MAQACLSTAVKLPAMLAPEAPEGVNEMVSSSLAKVLAAGVIDATSPAPAPATGNVKGLPLTATPLSATAIEQSAVAIAPFATAVSFSMLQRNGTRRYAATGDAPMDGEWAEIWTTVSL